VSVRCYTVLETVYRNRLHYTYSWAYTYTTLYPYNYNILYYHYYDKYHGSYMQDNRDKRAKGVDKSYQFMLRLKSPCGEIPPELYKKLDNLADTYGQGDLRITTRQAWQLHGIMKGDLNMQGGRSRVLLHSHRREGERGCAEEELSDEKIWFLKSMAGPRSNLEGDRMLLIITHLMDYDYCVWPQMDVISA
jgi:hypothetical protein